MKYSSNQHGTALPMTLFITVFLTISLAAAFSVIFSERRIINNTVSQMEALAVAESGLEKYFVNRKSLNPKDVLGNALSPVPTIPAVYESTTVNVPGGTAEVIVEQVKVGVDADADGVFEEVPIYAVRSVGTATGALGRISEAQRAVAQFATYQQGNMEVRAGWVSLTGVSKSGAAGSISGIDNCGAKGDIASVSVPDDPGFTCTGNNCEDGLAGSGTTGEDSIEDLGDTSADAADSISLDWAAVLAGNMLPVNLVFNDSTNFNNTTLQWIPPWPTQFQAAPFDPTYWPVVKVDRPDFRLKPPGGQGILIVTGDLDMDGSATWDGVVLVGGAFTSNGNNTISGTIFSGLNASLTLTECTSLTNLTTTDPQCDPGDSSLGNGTKIVQYDSCAIEKALDALRGLRPIPNAWMDNWKAF